MRGVHRAARPLRPDRPGRSARHVARGRSRGLPQSRRAHLERLSRRLLLQAADRYGSAREAPRRVDRALRLHVVARRATVSAQRLCGGKECGAVVRRYLRRPLLHGNHAARYRGTGRRQQRHHQARARDESAAGSDQRFAIISTRGTRRRTTCCSVSARAKPCRTRAA